MGGDWILLKDKVSSVKNTLIKVSKNDEKKDNKKSIENLVSIAIVLIVTLIAVNYILKGDKKKSEVNTNNNCSDYSVNNSGNNGQIKTDIVGSMDKENLEKRLAEILSGISGVGDVKVLLTYSQTNKINPVYNEDEQSSTTEETDTSGGKRIINSANNKKEVVYSNNNIITQSVSSPKVQGAVIIAKGAGDVSVKSDIIQAVAVATGLSTNKIQVFEMN